MRELQITSCMAPNADFICADLAGYISERLQLPTTFIGDIPSKGFTIKGSVGFTSPKGRLVRYASRILMRCKEFCRDEVLARTHEAFRAIRKPSICQVKPFEGDIPWQERERLFDAGHIYGCRIRGLPYVWKADQGQPSLELLVAPVMQGTRYQNRPVYFSDVIVLHTSQFHAFADLRGATWAYNEPGSHSGYNVVRYHLALLGETAGYFGRVIESGAHFKRWSNSLATSSRFRRQ